MQSIDGMSPDMYAEKALDISMEQADALFAGGNDRATLQRFRDKLAADPDSTPGWFV